VIEALKLAFNVLIRYRHRPSEDGVRQSPRRTVLWSPPRDFEEQPLHGLDSQECEETTVPARGVVGQEPTDTLTAPSWLTVVSASVVWASTTYIVCLYLFNRAEKRLIDAYHSFPLPYFISTLSLCTSSAQFQPSSSCTAFTRLQGAVSPCPCHKALSFRSVAHFPPRFLVIFSSPRSASWHFACQGRLVTPFTVTSRSFTHLARRRLYQRLQRPHRR
jgi:hypothetical protein